MYIAYAILMTTPWVIGTLFILIGIGAIIGKYLMEETFYRAGVRIYQEDKKKRDREALEDLVNIFEEMLKRIEAREKQKQLEVIYEVVTQPSVKVGYSLSVDNLFDTSELRGRNAHYDDEVYSACLAFAEANYWIDSSRKMEERNVVPHFLYG